MGLAHKPVVTVRLHQTRATACCTPGPSEWSRRFVHTNSRVSWFMGGQRACCSDMVIRWWLLGRLVTGKPGNIPFMVATGNEAISRTCRGQSCLLCRSPFPKLLHTCPGHLTQAVLPAVVGSWVRPTTGAPLPGADLALATSECPTC